MNKTVKIILLVLGIAILWVALAYINAGVLGLGVVLSVLALLDIATAEFSGNNKMVWLSICLAALLFAFIGIGSGYFKPTNATGENPIFILSTVISFFLPMAYFLLGRRQKISSKQ